MKEEEKLGEGKKNCKTNPDAFFETGGCCLKSIKVLTCIFITFYYTQEIFKINLYWSIVTLQCSVIFYCPAK